MSNAIDSKFLSFVSQVFDLAAAYVPAELRAIRERAGRRAMAPVGDVAAALLAVRADEPGTRSAPRGATKDAAVRLVRGALASKEVFPSNADIVRFARPFLAVEQRSKEGRTKLINRVLGAFLAAQPAARQDVLAKLRELTQDRKPTDFVAGWTRVIQGL